MTVVLDASALLAYLKDEPGVDVVEAILAESRISSVNWAEVIQKSIAAGVVVEGILDDLQVLGLVQHDRDEPSVYLTSGRPL